MARARKKEIVQTEAEVLLHQGGYLKAFDALVKEAERKAIKVPRTTVAQRKEILRDAIETLDAEKLTELQNKMAAVIDYIATNVVDLSDDHILTGEEAHGLMAEVIDEREAAELLAVRKDMIRTAVFNSITAEKAAKGVENPEHVNGSIPVPTLGMKFVREGCGLKDWTLNEDKLKTLLGEERWKAACEVERIPRQVIPAHVNYTLSHERLMKLAETESIILDWVADCLEVGGWKAPRLATRPL